MHHLTEHHLLIFLLQILVLLGTARTLSVICEKFDIPAITGDILAGVLLGATVFGKLSPSWQEMLFPNDVTQSVMLETVSWLGVFFLLLSSGFHVDMGQAIRSGKSAIIIGIVGVVIPIAIGIPIFSNMDSVYWGSEATKVSFTLFLSVAASITAISVVARSLGDLGINKTPQASLALSACAVNDIFGWFLFTIVISLVSVETFNTVGLSTTALSVIGFVAISLVLGSRILSWSNKWVQNTGLPQPAAAQTLIVSVGLLCGAITQWLGIHAILGFFLAGTVAGSASGISEDLRDSVSDTLNAIFVPLFFATIGLKIDFLVGLKFWPTFIFCVVAIIGKFVGAWLGARMSKESGQTSLLIGLIFIPGGAMEIVVASLALELELIGHTIFVAIVFAALLSSIIAGPLIGLQTRRMNISSAKK